MESRGLSPATPSSVWMSSESSPADSNPGRVAREERARPPFLQHLFFSFWTETSRSPADWTSCRSMDNASSFAVAFPLFGRPSTRAQRAPVFYGSLSDASLFAASFRWGPRAVAVRFSRDCGRLRRLRPGSLAGSRAISFVEATRGVDYYRSIAPTKSSRIYIVDHHRPAHPRAHASQEASVKLIIQNSVLESATSREKWGKWRSLDWR